MARIKRFWVSVAFPLWSARGGSAESRIPKAPFAVQAGGREPRAGGGPAQRASQSRAERFKTPPTRAERMAQVAGGAVDSQPGPLDFLPHLEPHWGRGAIEIDGVKNFP